MTHCAFVCKVEFFCEFNAFIIVRLCANGDAIDFNFIDCVVDECDECAFHDGLMLSIFNEPIHEID